MKIYSDVLTTLDLHKAAFESGVFLARCKPMPGRLRLRERGWIVGLSGSSPYASQLHEDKAATWDEHGIWMDKLFSIDPDAIISIYRGRDDFISKTRDQFEHHRRQVELYSEKQKHFAPWLDKVEIH